MRHFFDPEEVFMKGVMRIALTSFFLFAMAVTASGQIGMRGGPPDFHGVWSPVVGRGAAYEVQTSGGKKSQMELSIVAKELVDGKDAYWMEFVVERPETGGQIIMKRLMYVDGSGLSSDKVIMQMPGHPPMEMPARTGQMEKSQAADFRTDATDLGKESITVPAGTFTCEHYRIKDQASEGWISTEISPYGLVKYQSKDSTLVLTKVITDAKDKITGTPVPFNPMMMQQQGQRPQQ
jgi:hypothetical protein